jgi:histidine triad (HIT) family protein
MNKDKDCIFCKIVAKEIPAQILFEDADLIVIQDIKPSAPVHHLVIPKKHIKSVAEFQEDDKELIAEIFFRARDDAKLAGLNGYKTIFNVGKDGGQVIDHLHLHIMGGWNKKFPYSNVPI